MAVRLAWSVLAILGVGVAVWQLLSPIGDYSLSCSKTGEFFATGVAEETTCDTTVLGASGGWSSAVIVLVVAAPPVIAALAHRVWVSWVAFVALIAVGAVGVANWTLFWLILTLCALPMVIAALIIAGMHLGIVRQRRSTQQRVGLPEQQRA